MLMLFLIGPIGLIIIAILLLVLSQWKIAKIEIYKKHNESELNQGKPHESVGRKAKGSKFFSRI